MYQKVYASRILSISSAPPPTGWLPSIPTVAALSKPASSCVRTAAVASRTVCSFFSLHYAQKKEYSFQNPNQIISLPHLKYFMV